MEPFYNDTTKQNKGSEALSRPKILFFHEISLFKETFEVYFFMEFHVRSCWWTQRNLKLLSSRLWQSMENCSSIDNLMRISTGKCEGGLVLVILSVPHPTSIQMYYSLSFTVPGKLTSPDQISQIGGSQAPLRNQKVGAKREFSPPSFSKAACCTYLIGLTAPRLGVRAVTVPHCSWSQGHTIPGWSFNSAQSA